LKGKLFFLGQRRNTTMMNPRSNHRLDDELDTFRDEEPDGNYKYRRDESDDFAAKTDKEKSFDCRRRVYDD